MKSYYYLLGIGAYLISFLIWFNICLKLDVEKFINSKMSKRIGMILASFILSIVGILIIDSLNIAKEYQLIVKGFFVYGPTTSLLVWALPVKSNRKQ
jgi:fucose permease